MLLAPGNAAAKEAPASPGEKETMKEGGREGRENETPQRAGCTPNTLWTVLELSPLGRKSGRWKQRKPPQETDRTFSVSGRLPGTNEIFQGSQATAHWEREGGREALSRVWPGVGVAAVNTGFLASDSLEKASSFFRILITRPRREGPGSAPITVPRRRLKFQETGGGGGEQREVPCS